MNEQEEVKIDISGDRQRIFLASPYTHNDKAVMTFRYEAALAAVSELINEGNIIFSPIVHSHPIAVTYNLQRDYSFWQAYTNSFILHWAEAFAILCLPGWEYSVGIIDESILARKIKLPISYIHLGQY